MVSHFFRTSRLLKQIAFVSLVTLALTSLPSPALAAEATLSLSPATGAFSVGDTISVKILVDGGSEKMNAVEANLSYDKTLLSVTSISKQGSVFTLWTTEPTFSNGNGTMTFGGGSPSPFSGKSTLVTVSFKTLKEGSADVKFTSGSVLAADGRGTDILSKMTPAKFDIAAKAPPPPKETGEEVGANPPPAPVLVSTTHPSPEEWSKEKTAKFTWQLPSDVTAVRTLFGSKPTVTPTVIYEPAVAEKELPDLEDGIWYFHVQFKNKDGWGEVTHRKILVDTLPPEKFELVVLEGATSSKPVIGISTSTDVTSGIKAFELSVAALGTKPIEVKLEEIKESKYQLPQLPKGKHSVVLRAFDKAGNVSEAKLELTVEEGKTIAKKEVPVEEVEKPSFIRSHLTEIFIGMLFVVIAGLIAMMIMERKKFSLLMTQASKETVEIRSKMEKILSALRDEVEDQIHALDKKPRLSDAEKKAMAKLKEAIDISEELIDKEIEDVEKILK